METGKLTREATWEKNSEVMRGVAEEVVGRESKTNGMPCLRACRKEVLLSKRRVAESYARLQNARRTEHFTSESERHRRVKRNERDFERKQKKEAVLTICVELESAYENHETGKQYRLLRELGVNLRDDDYSGIEARRQHFLKTSGEPNDPPLTAPGDDEITVDMIETAPIPIQECILRLLVKMWQEADNEGEQEHWSPAVHKAVVLMLYKRKGDYRSLDNYRGICLLSMISRSRCSKHFENLGIMVNEQWGFRRERSTRDVIWVARAVAELSSEWERNLEVSRSAMERAGTWEKNAERWVAEHKMYKETQPMLYLADIKKAYPSAPRQPMWDLLKRNGLPPRILAVFRRLHSETSYSVRLR